MLLTFEATIIRYRTIKVNGKSGLYDAYSYIFVPGSGGDGNSYAESGDENQDGHPKDFINCEHTWPQSFFDKKLIVSSVIVLFASALVIAVIKSAESIHLPYIVAVLSAIVLGCIEPRKGWFLALLQCFLIILHQLIDF